MEDLIKLIQSWDPTHRLSWDQYFISTAFLIASRSADLRLKVGCVLVKDNHVISLGYNGYLPKLSHESYIENGHELATVHAEQNCVSDCSKRGVSTEGATAYITHYPCINCFKILVSAGVKTINYAEDYKNHELVSKLAKDGNISMVKIF